ncbi:MAG TPA: hypothetical protein VFD01_13905 [Candidatus Dormibacteraeota bacterium]|nr:hypothetical protein [Candidatus Dormibacteraeota bacterium]
MILDLSQGFWKGRPLHPRDRGIPADGKTSVHARRAVAPGPGRPGLVEREDERGGAIQYLTA